MSNNANNSNVQFFLDILQNEFGGSQQTLDNNNNNNDIQQIYELFRNISGIRSQIPSQQRASTGLSNNRYNSSGGFALRAEPTALQNLQSASENPSNSTRLREVDSVNLNEFEALGFDNNTNSRENRRTSRTNSFVDDIPINTESNRGSTPVQQPFNIRHNSLDDQIRRNQNSIRDIIDDYNENMIQYNRNMDRWMISYNDNFHQYQHNTEHIIRLLQEFQIYIIQSQLRTNVVNPPPTRPVNPPRVNTRTGNRYTTHNNTNPINWTAFIPLRYNSSRYLDNRLTQAQIDTSTQMIEYNADMDEERCPISWEDFVVGEQICQIKECEHIFKSASLLNWLRTNSHCPVCRYDLRTYNGTTPGRVSRTTSNPVSRTTTNQVSRTTPNQVSMTTSNRVNDSDVSLNIVNIDTQHANENPYIDNNDEIETIYTTSIDLNIDSINNLDAILESVMQQIGDDIVRSIE